MRNAANGKRIDKMMKRHKGEYILTLLCIVGIVCFHLYNIKDIYGLVIFPDEAGYWSVAAYLNGYDWSGIMCKAPYYGWGYGGTLLALLFKIVRSPILLYRGAVLINALMLCGNFLVLKKIAEELSISSNGFVHTLAALTVSLYSSYAFFSKTTYAESLLVLLFDVLTMLVLSNREKEKNLTLVIMGMICAGLFSVHQRAIGVAGALMLVLGLRTWRKSLTIKQCILFFLCFFSFLFLAVKIKHNMVISIWINENNATANDFQGQMEKLEYLLSWEGIIAFLFNVLGRIVYLGNATFLLFYLGMEKIIRKLHEKFIKKNRECCQTDFALFLCLSIAAAISISAVFMIIPTRFEHIIYGRYSEYVIAPLLIYEILSIDFSSVRRKLRYIVPIHISLSIFVYIYSSHLEFHSQGIFSTVGVRWLRGLTNMSDMVKYLLWAMQITVLLATILCFLGRKRRELFMIMLSCLWLYAGNKVFSDAVKPGQERNKEFYTFAENAEETVEDETIYYLLEDEERGTDVYYAMFRMKFFLAYQDMMAITYEELGQQKEGYVLIHKKSKNADIDFSDVTSWVMEDDTFRLGKMNT